MVNELGKNNEPWKSKQNVGKQSFILRLRSRYFNLQHKQQLLFTDSPICVLGSYHFLNPQNITEGLAPFLFPFYTEKPTAYGRASQGSSQQQNWDQGPVVLDFRVTWNSIWPGRPSPVGNNTPPYAAWTKNVYRAHRHKMTPRRGDG